MKRAGWIFNASLLLIEALFLTQSLRAATSEHPIQFSQEAIQLSCERSLDYLTHYHEDFKSLRIDYEYSRQNTIAAIIQVRDPNGVIIRRFSVTAETFNRSIFHELATLLLQTNTPRVRPSALNALENAWYWDALATENPAVFDQLNASPGNVRPDEQNAFWRYRLLMQQNGGRDRLWGKIKSNPSIVEGLDPRQPLSPQDTLELLELKHYRLSPVQSLEESENLLRCLRTFTLKPADSRKTEWVSIEQLPLKLLLDSNSEIDSELEHRLFMIKSSLPSANPLFLNSLQSLGVCFERLLDHDASGYQTALKRFIQDADFSRRVQREIVRNRQETPAE